MYNFHNGIGTELAPHNSISDACQPAYRRLHNQKKNV